MKTAGRMKTALRARLWSKTDGRCFYCGVPMMPDRPRADDRDWLLPMRTSELTTDHKQPTRRGGSDAEENLNPCCHRCNSMKNIATVDEFRLRTGLQAGKWPYRFYGDPASVDRDVIVVVSPAFVRAMVIHNYPRAVEASSINRSRPRR